MSTKTTPADFTEANRVFFDDLAARYDFAPWQRKVAFQITNYIQQSLDVISPSLAREHREGRTPAKLSLLDYACGTGMISRALGPYVTTIKAMDLSSKMVERYTELAKESEIPSVKSAQVFEGNLLTDAEPSEALNGPEMHEFDIAAIGLGVHHFADPAKAIGRLAERLKVGGELLIVDFVEDGDETLAKGTGAEHTIHKHGFSEGEIRDVMTGQGLSELGWLVMPEKVEMQFSNKTSYKTVFLARATKGKASH